MAQSIGAEVITEYLPWDEPNFHCDASMARIKARMAEFKPKLVTAVHCETPCGSINPALVDIGKLARENGALFLVDAVSSVSGVPILVDVRIPIFCNL